MGGGEQARIVMGPTVRLQTPGPWDDVVGQAAALAIAEAVEAAFLQVAMRFRCSEHDVRMALARVASAEGGMVL